MGPTAKQPPTENKPTLIFLHIPKAGGTTLRRIVEKHYPRGSRFRIYHDTKTPLERFRKLKPDQKRRIRCISGHMPFGIHKQLEQSCTYITMMRHPVSRIISQYSYIKKHPRNYLYDVVTSQNMTLSEFACSGIASELHNGQVRFISGRMSEELMSEFASVSEDDLRMAKRNLETHFSVVGVVEMFDESLLLMKRRFGWRDIFYSKHNVTKKTIDSQRIKEEVIKLIRQHNHYDLELYEFVKCKLETEILSLGPAFGSELYKFRRANRLYGGFLRPLERVSHGLERSSELLKLAVWHR